VPADLSRNDLLEALENLLSIADGKTRASRNTVKKTQVRMTSAGKDSAEVVKFMTLFARLKEYCDDTPEDVVELAKKDDSVSKIASNLFWAGHFLRESERRHRTLFTAPVNPGFQKAWRDYEVRYEGVMAEAMLGGFPDFLNEGEADQTTKAEREWHSAALDAAEEAKAIEEAIDFAQFNVEQDWRDFPEGYAEDIQRGIDAWTNLKKQAGFDLKAVFRRRALIPFVLVPRSVAARHGSAEKLSLLNNLQQAHDAFTYGVPHAALALMRSILEAVLRDHYGAEGSDMSERIQNARGLPRAASATALHRLRKLANAALHLNRDDDAGLSKMDEVRLEKEIVSLLLVLRSLIEGVDDRNRWQRPVGR
jgi:hypothetical protein